MNSYIRLTADTEMVAVATSALNGQALAFAVAVADQPAAELSWCFRDDGSFGNIWTEDHGCYRPDRDWDLGGPLIEQHRPLFTWCGGMVRAEVVSGIGSGDTYLIAICRAIVAAKLGEVVSVPAELVQAVQS